MFNLYEIGFQIFTFVLGSIVGSFLNVCIYRLPRDISVNNPRRSFCPNCKSPIPFRYNLPIIGWFLTKGRCAHCRAPVSFRYPAVEFLTAILFWALAIYFPYQIVWAYWIFVSCLIVVTFVDLEFLIIPDQVSIGACAAGIISCFIQPQLMGQISHLGGLLHSILGAFVGYAFLWIIVELGKLAFGKKRIVLPESTEFEWKKLEDNGDALIQIGPDQDLWSDLFQRKRDRLILVCDTLFFAGVEHKQSVLTCFYDRIELEGKTYPISELNFFQGQLSEFIFPREAMGFGDVKLMAAIGAFLGWGAVFFSIVCASFIGSIAGVFILILGPKARSLKIPFGPYLALAALIYLFAGNQMIAAYIRWLHR